MNYVKEREIKMAGQNRRRKYFIDREFQTKFILRFWIPIILTALISACVVYYYSSQSTTTVFENSRLMIKATTEFIRPGLVLSTFISIAIVGVAIIVVMLFVSHRIAGPIYKLESSLERLGSGDLGFDIHLRRRDELKDVAEIFNSASKSLNSLIGDVKAESSRLNSAVTELKPLLEKLSTDEVGLRETIKKLEDANSLISEKLNQFRLR